MPIWSEILEELHKNPLPDGRPDHDRIRRKYLHSLNLHTNRNVILYSSGWLQKDAPPNLTSITDEDIQAFMEITYGLQGQEIDIILHSPGGMVEAAEAIVSYLRSRFSHIRVIVPQLAMSAATMISCAADEIVMGKHSFLGPTDPQFLLQTPLGFRSVAAQAILDQFDKAKRECSDPANLAVWLQILNQYGPDLLVQCEAAMEMSKELVETWLSNYMFSDTSDHLERAKSIADWLSGHKNFKSHSRHLARGTLKEHGLKIVKLEDNQQLQDLSLSVFHATTHTFSATPAVKIVENHMGRAFIKIHNAEGPKDINHDMA